MLDLSVRQLMAILNDILDAAKLRENGIEMHPSSNEINEITSLVETTFAATAEAKKIRFSIDVDNKVRNQWINVDSVR